jgi:hypothetical protein
MYRIAAIRTTGSRPPLAEPLERRCSFVEDLNWPSSVPGTPRKASRPTEVWVPNRSGEWQGDVPTLQ